MGTSILGNNEGMALLSQLEREMKYLSFPSLLQLIILLKEIYRDLGLIDVLHMDRGILQNFLVRRAILN